LQNRPIKLCLIMHGAKELDGGKKSLPKGKKALPKPAKEDQESDKSE